MTSYIYRPDTSSEELTPLNSTLGVKFCKDTILLESFLRQHNIEYRPEDLEMTYYGPGLRIKKGSKVYKEKV